MGLWSCGAIAQLKCWCYYVGEVIIMMTSPEYYYEEFLQGKSEKEIRAVIRRLKREIGRLKEYSCRS